jgi:hypothetical protein
VYNWKCKPETYFRRSRLLKLWPNHQITDSGKYRYLFETCGDHSCKDRHNFLVFLVFVGIVSRPDFAVTGSAVAGENKKGKKKPKSKIAAATSSYCRNIRESSPPKFSGGKVVSLAEDASIRVFRNLYVIYITTSSQDACQTKNFYLLINQAIITFSKKTMHVLYYDIIYLLS